MKDFNPICTPIECGLKWIRDDPEKKINTTL